MKALLLPLCLLSTAGHALEALDEVALSAESGQDGLSARLEWRLNAAADGTADFSGGNNSIAIKSNGQNEYLMFHKNSGVFIGHEMRLDVGPTPASLSSSGSVIKDAFILSMPGALEFKKWRIDEISIGTTATSAPGQNGLIAGFETNAIFRFGANTKAYFFTYP